MEKIRKKVKKYIVEVVILAVAFVIAVVSLTIYLKNYQSSDEENINYSLTSPKPQTPLKIYVDVSGSVNKPDLYEVPAGARLKDLIKKAGGLSDDADKGFFGRNFNLARKLADQEKIYIPSTWEINNGYFTESQKILDYLPPNLQSSTANHQSFININSASLEELDTLPGIGKITAQKIIDNRPFEALEKLIDKKIINKTVFENIKTLITL